MLRITVEVVPSGMGEPRPVATVEIANVSPGGLPENSMYRALVRERTDRRGRVATIRHRRSRGWAALVEKALRECRLHGEPAPIKGRWWDIPEDQGTAA